MKASALTARKKFRPVLLSWGLFCHQQSFNLQGIVEPPEHRGPRAVWWLGNETDSSTSRVAVSAYGAVSRGNDK